MITTEQIRQFRLLTDWFISVIEHIREEDGSETLADHTNSMEWLAGHLTHTRARNIVRLGIEIEPYKFAHLYVDPEGTPGTFAPFDKSKTYPTLKESIEEWTNYSAIFMEVLQTADAKVFNAEIPLVGPTGGNTVGDLLVSVALHEAFHIGQMSMIRKALGYKAMYWFHRL